MLAPLSASSYDCIVLGAGIAGLSAARALATASRRVLILEARSRVGGRLLSHFSDGHWFELGAEFVHGRPPELLSLLEEGGLPLLEVEGRPYCFQDGALGPCPEDRAAHPLLHAMAAEAAHGDRTFDAYLQQSSAPQTAKQQARDYVEGFNAADAREIGIVGLARQQAAEDAIEGDRAARLPGGYSALVRWLYRELLALGTTLHLASPVETVAWQPGQCHVRTVTGASFHAPQLLCTVPLGVLQAGTPRFDPEPAAALGAARSLSPGRVQRAVLQFHHRWWEQAAPGLGWLFTRDLPLPVWWTTGQPGSPLLTAWVGGPPSRHFPDAEALRDKAIATLRTAFGRRLSGEVKAMHAHDWTHDPWTLGAYSSVPAGAADAPGILAIPVEQTLFFAGEHTDTTGHPGTVHGALRSALRAAEQMLSGAAAR